MFGALLFGFSRIKFELAELLGIVESQCNHFQDLGRFKITEFALISKNLKKQIEVAQAEVEAKSALEVARQVAHDIRSPILSLQIAVSAAQNQLDGKIRRVINHSAQRISDIAEDVMEKHLEPTNLAQRARSALPMSTKLAITEIISEKKLMCSTGPGVKFQMEAPEDLVIEMRVSDFKRVLSNLIDNAVHAIGGAGLITIESKRNIEGCEISVKDNGKGMRNEVVEAVLEKGGSFGKVGGKGLGLQWVKRMSELHGGRLEISSTVGCGTCVTVYFPRIVTAHESDHEIEKQA